MTAIKQPSRVSRTLPAHAPAAWRCASWPPAAIFAVVMVILCAAPWLVYPAFLMRVLCLAMFAASFNLLLGYAGLMSFGHAAFFGMGAYMAAWTAQSLGWPIEASIAAGCLTGAAMGVCFGFVAIRRQGIYFAMITLALAQLVYFYSVKASFTNGEDGIQGVLRGKLFGLFALHDNIAMYYLVLAIFALSFGAVWRIIHSPFGRVVEAIRLNEPRAVSLGFHTQRYKLTVFVMSTALAGLAGATKVFAFGFATLTDVQFTMSGLVVLIALVGGLRTVYGPLVGALIVTGMEYYLAPLGDILTVVEGAIFVGCVLVFRLGVVGYLAEKSGARQTG